MRQLQSQAAQRGREGGSGLSGHVWLYAHNEETFKRLCYHLEDILNAPSVTLFIRNTDE